MRKLKEKYKDQDEEERQLRMEILAVSFSVGRTPGTSCSKLTMSFVNVSLKFQTFIPQIHQYFLLKKCEKLLQCKSFSHFFKKKYLYFVIKL